MLSWIFWILERFQASSSVLSAVVRYPTCMSMDLAEPATRWVATVSCYSLPDSGIQCARLLWVLSISNYSQR